MSRHHRATRWGDRIEVATHVAITAVVAVAAAFLAAGAGVLILLLLLDTLGGTW